MTSCCLLKYNHFIFQNNNKISNSNGGTFGYISTAQPVYISNIAFPSPINHQQNVFATLPMFIPSTPSLPTVPLHRSEFHVTQTSKIGYDDKFYCNSKNKARVPIPNNVQPYPGNMMVVANYNATTNHGSCLSFPPNLK